ncbi:MAG: hypothetical protein DHS20C10_02730 [marine bacterium B5-7]|nr:MAG: hypothetical protein DHS20C10_02730 [marine bacterium B5-7]
MKHWKKGLCIALLGAAGLVMAAGQASSTQQNIAVVKGMFKHVISAHDLSKMPDYFTQDAVMFDNNYRITLQDDIEIHKNLYKAIPKITYDFQDIFACGDKVVARLWFAGDVNGQPSKFRELFIAKIKHGKIYRMWDMYMPFKAYSKATKKTDITK